MSETIPSLPPASPTMSHSSTRGWEVMCHLSSVIGMLGYLGMIPFGNVVAPLVVWLLKRNESLGVDAHGKESLNFHISWTLYWLIGMTVVTALCFVLIGFLLIPVMIVAGAAGWLMMLILTLIASVKASNGEIYRYPLTIRFLK